MTFVLNLYTYREHSRNGLGADVEGFGVAPFAMRYHDTFRGWVITHMPSGYALHHPWQGLTRSAATTLIAWLIDHNIASKIADDGSMTETAWLTAWEEAIVATMTIEVETGVVTERP